MTNGPGAASNGVYSAPAQPSHAHAFDPSSSTKQLHRHPSPGPPAAYPPFNGPVAPAFSNGYHTPPQPPQPPQPPFGAQPLPPMPPSQVAHQHAHQAPMQRAQPLPPSFAAPPPPQQWMAPPQFGAVGPRSALQSPSSPMAPGAQGMRMAYNNAAPPPPPDPSAPRTAAGPMVHDRSRGAPPPPLLSQEPSAHFTGQALPPGMTDDLRRMGVVPPMARGVDSVDLMQERDILARGLPEPPSFVLPQVMDNPSARCDAGVFRSTLNAWPQTRDLLSKCRLPLGLVLNSFRDLKELNVLQTSLIVRCRSCRTYINPFVVISDVRHWKCNICYRTNDLPDEFSWNPTLKCMSSPRDRPEIQHATVEFIAPGEYAPIRLNAAGNNEVSRRGYCSDVFLLFLSSVLCLTAKTPPPSPPPLDCARRLFQLRQPQAAVYVFVLDVSAHAVQTGYLHSLSARLLSRLDKMPGDERTAFAFLTFDSAVHFYEFTDTTSPPRQIVVSDVDDLFRPCSDGLVVQRRTHSEAIKCFVQDLPSLFENNVSNQSAMGAAVKTAYELVSDFGGRITVVQTVLPDVGPGALSPREDPNLRAASEVQNLGPATDFYKRLALDCCGHQVAFDLFLLNSQYADLVTISELARLSGGCVYHHPNLHMVRNLAETRRFERAFERYLTRKIGFEAVLRVRCTKGLAMRKFHGSCFVRSTDLLTLPNCNPDSSIGVEVEMNDNLTDVSSVCFQAALLYTSVRGDRRIRVHTLCLPITKSPAEVHAKADMEAIVALLSKLAVDRGLTSSVSDAREALVNAAVDAVGAFGRAASSNAAAGLLLAPTGCMRLLPLYILGLLKHSSLTSGTSVKLDDRVFAMLQFKTLPLELAMLQIYPALYALHTLTDSTAPTRLQLSYERVDRHGVYLLDNGVIYCVYVGQAVADHFCKQLFGVDNFARIDEDALDLPELDSDVSRCVGALLKRLNAQRPFASTIRIIREDGARRALFANCLVEDRTNSSKSYVEFLQDIRRELSPNR